MVVYYKTGWLKITAKKVLSHRSKDRKFKTKLVVKMCSLHLLWEDSFASSSFWWPLLSSKLLPVASCGCFLSSLKRAFLLSLPIGTSALFTTPHSLHPHCNQCLPGRISFPRKHMGWRHLWIFWEDTVQHINHPLRPSFFLPPSSLFAVISYNVFAEYLTVTFLE